MASLLFKKYFWNDSAGYVGRDFINISQIRGASELLSASFMPALA